MTQGQGSGLQHDEGVHTAGESSVSVGACTERRGEDGKGAEISAIYKGIIKFRDGRGANIENKYGCPRSTYACVLYACHIYTHTFHPEGLGEANRPVVRSSLGSQICLPHNDLHQCKQGSLEKALSAGLGMEST